MSESGDVLTILGLSRREGNMLTAHHGGRFVLAGDQSEIGSDLFGEEHMVL